MLAPYVLGALGLASGVRALWRPHRAVTRDGSVQACPGKNKYGACDPTIRIAAPVDTPAFSPLPGTVVAVGDDFVHIMGRREAVVVMVDGIEPSVVEGQSVGTAQRVGDSLGQVGIGVWELIPGDPFGIKTLDPASWLAARGIRVVSNDGGSGELWCEGGRDITVPESAGTSCELRRPQPGKFALLPVQVSVSR